MSSPIKTKNKKKQPSQSKKKQLLSVFQQTIPFLQIFTPQQIDYLQDKIHIFVFNRGQILAKEMEQIDYIGVIAEGRAVSKSKNYNIGDTIGHLQVLGYTQKHLQNITGQADGIIIAIRVYDLVTLPKPQLINKIVSYIAELYTGQLLKRQDLSKQINQFQLIEEKKISKYLTPQWNKYFTDMDLKQKHKFISFFPFYSVKQKDLLMNSTIKPSLLYVINGQVIIKNKMQQKIVESGKMINFQGFILNNIHQQNVYCLSSEAVVLIINRNILQNNFKSSTFGSLMKIVLNTLDSEYKKVEEKKQQKQGKDGDMWSMFKKHPDRQIVPLPKKTAQLSKNVQLKVHTQNQNSSIAAFQTMFREQLGLAQGKVKTVSSVADSNYERLFSLKTEPQAKESISQGELQKLRKQVDILTQKLKFTQEMNIQVKLNFIEYKSKLSMASVFKQIRKIHQEQEQIYKVKATQGHVSESLLTFKEAFDKQIKQNKIRQLVAKCAFKWLYLTRRNKVNKKS